MSLPMNLQPSIQVCPIIHLINYIRNKKYPHENCNGTNIGFLNEYYIVSFMTPVTDSYKKLVQDYYMMVEVIRCCKGIL